jgi:hypothetical protein
MQANTFSSIPDSITARALANNFTMEEKNRRENAVINKNFYYGDTDKYVSTYNIEVEAYTLNLTRPVIHKRSSMLYSRKLVRTFDGPQSSISFLEKVYSENNIDSFLGNVDLMSEMTGNVLVSPVVTDKLPSKIKLQSWDAASFSALTDEEDPEMASAVSIIKLVDRIRDGWEKGVLTNERIIKQQVWTENSVVTYDGSYLKKSEENPYSFLPFVNFRGEEVPGQFVGYAPATLVRKLNAHINQLLTDLGYTIKMQSASPVALKGYQSGEGIILSPGRAISLPAGADAVVLDFNPKIEEVLTTVQYLEEKIYETSSTPKISIVGGEGTSGRELLVRWFPLIQVFQEKVVRFHKYELELANTILRIVDMPTVENVQIDFPEDDVLPLSPSEETLERDIILGIKTPVDEILRKNPHLTQDEAIAIIEENNDIAVRIGLGLEEEGEEEEVPQ